MAIRAKGRADRFVPLRLSVKEPNAAATRADVDRIQDQIATFINSGSGNIDITKGVLVEGVRLPTNGRDIRVDHSLGRPFKGYLIVRQNVHRVQSNLRESEAENTQPDKSIIFQYIGSETATVSLWVF